MTTHHEVVIVGAGQASLATAWHLQRRGASALLLDADDRIGDRANRGCTCPCSTARAKPRLRDDTTALPGLRFVGLPWQRSRGSALLGWVSEDAALVADRMAITPAPELQVAA